MNITRPFPGSMDPRRCSFFYFEISIFSFSNDMWLFFLFLIRSLGSCEKLAQEALSRILNACESLNIDVKISLQSSSVCARKSDSSSLSEYCKFKVSVTY